MPTHPFAPGQEVYWDPEGRTPEGYRSMYGNGPFKVLRACWDASPGSSTQAPMVVVATMGSHPERMFAGDPVRASLFKSEPNTVPPRQEGEMRIGDAVVWSARARHERPSLMDAVDDVVMVVDAVSDDGRSVIVSRRQTGERFWGTQFVPVWLFELADPDD